MTKQQTATHEVQGEAPTYDVYHISEKEDGNHVWIKVGVALLNQDGSINVFLNALPVDGKLQIRKGRAKAKGGDAHER